MSDEIIVKWSWHDIQAMYPHYTQKQAMEALETVGDYVHERVVELGNEVLQQVVYELVEIELEVDDE
jgi:hypothetical protein